MLGESNQKPYNITVTKRSLNRDKNCNRNY